MVSKVIVYFTSFLSSGFWDPNLFYDVAFSIWLESKHKLSINSQIPWIRSFEAAQITTDITKKTNATPTSLGFGGNQQRGQGGNRALENFCGVAKHHFWQLSWKQVRPPHDL